MNKLTKLIVLLVHLLTSTYALSNDTLIFKNDIAIRDLNVGIPQAIELISGKRIFQISLDSDIFEFDGYLYICFECKDYYINSDSVIDAKVGWSFIEFHESKIEMIDYRYDRYVRWWLNGFLYGNVPYSNIVSFMYRISKKMYNYSFTSPIFLRDERYYLSTKLFETNKDFYSLKDFEGLCQIYKSKFKAVILSYELEDKNLKVLMPVSEALEFRPATESEAEAMGYEKANVFLILK